MRQRSKFFLVVLMLMFAGNIFSQINTGGSSYSYAKDIKMYPLCDSLVSLYHYTPKFQKKIFVSNSCWTSPPGTMHVFYLLSPIAKDFSAMQLGIVCKKEFEFEKKTSIPLRLRLGSLDYTNYLEQKPNALKPL
jgi:hypothetical protein